jgi:hypothetical protein
MRKPTADHWIWIALLFVPQFLIAQQSKTPWVEFGSSIRITATAYHITGQDFRQEPFSYFIHGTPRLTVKGFDIPVSFIFSNHQRSIQQPFNRFGISPQYKWVKGYLGYNTMMLSKYTFSNRQFLGAGVELNPGKFRLGALYGRLQKAIREDSTGTQEPNNFLLQQSLPRFERRAFGGKVGFGTRESFVDIVGMKAFDIMGPDDPIDTLDVRPQENVALGLHSQLKLTKTLQLKFDVASSVYTRDTSSADHELSSTVAWIGNVLQPKTSTQVLFAGEAAIIYKQPVWGIQVGYKRIDPDYKSMGVYYLQSDISQWTIAPNLSLLNKTLRLRGQVGIQKDNLYETRLATSKRLITSAHAQWNQSRAFQIGAFYTNFGLTQTPGLKALTDSTRISQVNGSYGLSPSLFLVGKTWQHQIYGTVSYNKLSFNKSSIIAPEDIRTSQLNAGYTLSPVSSNKFTVGALFTALKTDATTSVTTSTGLGGNGTYTDKKGLFRAGAQAQYFINSIDETENGNSLVLTADINYQLKKQIQFFLLGQLIKHETPLSLGSFTENQFTLGLQINL